MGATSARGGERLRRWADLGPAAAIALLAAILLGIQVPADPATGVTFSTSPFTDEGWSVLGARNQALLGTWSTDEWQLFWTQLPFQVATWATFEVAGVGIVQARLVSVAASVLAAATLTWFLGRWLGAVPAILAGSGLVTSTLFLYYGRLALLEPMVVLFQVAGFAALFPRGEDRSWPRTLLPGALLALAIGTKPSAMFAIAAGLAAAWVAGGGVPGLRRRVVASFLVIGAFGAAWLGVVLAQPALIDLILRTWAPQDFPSSVGEAIERTRLFLANSDGALPALRALLVASTVSLVLAAVSWRRLDPHRRALLAIGTAWFVVGFAVLCVVPYRPSRYVLPLVPGLAIAVAVGASVALEHAGRFRTVAAAAVLGLAVVAAIPGARDLEAWMSRATYRLPEIQARVLELVTDGRPMEGGPAPTMGMRVPVPAIVPRSVNQGDLYEEHGVGWLLIGPDLEPLWADEHPEVWAAREVIECYAWGSGPACLVRLP